MAQREGIPAEVEKFFVSIRKTFRAPPERVFQAWTRPEEVTKWFGPAEFASPKAEIDLRVGGKYRFHLVGPDGKSHIAAGEYREISPPHRLVFTWGWETGADPFESLVTLDFLSNSSGGTEFVMLHDRFPNQELRDNHNKGWTSTLEKFTKCVD